MTVGRLLADMSSVEFALWLRFSREVGFGEHRDDWRQAIGFANVCAALGASVRPDQLIPKFGSWQRTPLAKLRSWLTDPEQERFYG